MLKLQKVIDSDFAIIRGMLLFVCVFISSDV